MNHITRTFLWRACLSSAVAIGSYAQAAAFDWKVHVNSKEGVHVDLANGYADAGNATVSAENWGGTDGLTNYVLRYTAGSVEIKTANGAAVVNLKDPFTVKYNAGTKTFTLYQGDQVIPNVGPAYAAKIKLAKKIGGQFVTGAIGKLEKFNLHDDASGADREEYELVFRDSEGKFLSHANVDREIERKWSREGDSWAWEERWKAGSGAGLAGRWVHNNVLADLRLASGKLNSHAFICYQTQQCPALAVRDKSDSRNEGKFLTLVYASVYPAQPNGNKPERCIYYPKKKDVDSRFAGKELTDVSTSDAADLCGTFNAED